MQNEISMIFSMQSVISKDCQHEETRCPSSKRSVFLLLNTSFLNVLFGAYMSVYIFNNFALFKQYSG